MEFFGAFEIIFSTVIIFFIVLLLLPIFLEISLFPLQLKIGVFLFKKEWALPSLKKRKKERLKKSPKEKISQKKSEKATPKKSWKNYYRLIRSSEFIEIAKRICQTAIRLLKAFRLVKLDWQIGLSDFYHQGIIESILINLPTDKNLLIEGNFLEQNSFFLKIQTNFFLILYRFSIFLCSMPWIQIYKLIRKFSADKNTV